jgi:biotin synthase
MSGRAFDGTNNERLGILGRRVLGGGEITREEAQWLFHLENSSDIYDLLSWANRIREHFKGNKIHLCSIVNVKAGACSENCRFCSQSAMYQTESPRYGLIEAEPVMTAAEEAKAKGVTALGLVAAWRGLDEGPALDEICSRLEELKRSGKARPDG